MNNTYIFDIDNTICYDTPYTKINFKKIYQYDKSKPNKKIINKINKLYKNNYIILFTSRGMRTYNGNSDLIEKNVRPTLEKWLDDNNVLYHELHMSKPWNYGNLYIIDDRNLTINQFLAFGEEDFEKLIRINNEQN